MNAVMKKPDHQASGVSRRVHGDGRRWPLRQWQFCCVGWLGVSWMSVPRSTVTRPPVDDAIISRPANTVPRPSKMIIERQQVPNAANEQVANAANGLVPNAANEQQQVANAANEQQQVPKPLPVPQDCLPGHVWREAYRNDRRLCHTRNA